MSWKDIPDEFTIDDIGARLLANLAKGIYNHEAVLREYVQNACDGYRKLDAIKGNVPSHEPIQIQVEDDSTLLIHDRGIGMDLSDVRKAKRIAVSDKQDGDAMIGFRGIGIWAGFQACESLEVITTKVGDPHRYKLEIKFAEILPHVDENINIKELLDDRFYIREEPEDIEEHYTTVRLVGLLGDYRHLTDQDELRRIVSQVLPCRVDPTFKYKTRLDEFLNGVEGFEEYSILVNSDEVFKSFPASVETFNFAVLTRDNEEIGKVWWATGTKSLTPVESKFQFRKFRLRVRNFAVGNVGIYGDEDASGLGIVEMQQLKSVTNLNWHVGEIYITHPEVRPDTPRNQLELDSMSRRAIEAIRLFYSDRIAESKALSEFNTCKQFLEKSKTVTSGTVSVTQEELAQILANLEEQLRFAASRATTDKVKKKKRELIGTRDYKQQLKTQIALLQQMIIAKPAAPKPEMTSPATATPTTTPTGAKSQNSQSNNGGAKEANGNLGTSEDDGSWEDLISDIFAVVKDKVGSDDELYDQICTQIFALFTERGLINAEE